jgi:hypothetical protein
LSADCLTAGKCKNRKDYKLDNRLHLTLISNP